MQAEFCFLPDDIEEVTPIRWVRRPEKLTDHKTGNKTGPSTSKGKSNGSHVASPELEEGFAIVDFPPKMPAPVSFEGLQDAIASRSQALSAQEFATMTDQDGRLVNEHQLRQAVFRGGVDPCIRQQVWQFLFGLYPFHSTAREREILLADHYIKYRALKSRWKKVLREESDSENLLSPGYLDGVDNPEITPDVELLTDCPASPTVPSTTPTCLPGGSSPHVQQQLAFMEIQAQVYAGRQNIDMDVLIPAIRIIDKDVPRTDRDCSFFQGQHNPNLQVLRDVLITFAAYHPCVNYAQGMNDILSQFLEILGSEVEAYWCFTHYMERIQKDFSEDGLMQKLDVVRELLLELDADLWNYLDQLGLGDMSFCHRWLLLSFKREFPRSASLKCFEVLSSLHLELSSMEAEKIRARERRKDFCNIKGKNRLEDIPVNKDYTFTVFMCITILVENRQPLFNCHDTADVIELICGLTKNMELDGILAKSEVLFSRYCQKSVSDCFQVLEPVPKKKP